MRDVILDPSVWEGLEADAQALLAQWEVNVGQPVQEGQTLGTAELVKASVAIEAPIGGRVAALVVPAGENFDRAAVLEDCARTGRLLVVHDAVQAGGFGAEVAATAAQATGCRVARIGAPRIPVGYATRLESVARIQPPAVVRAAQSLMTESAQAASA